MECPKRGPSWGEEQEERNRWKRVVIEESEEERARRVVDQEQQGKGFTMSEKRGSLQKLLETQVHAVVTALHHEVRIKGSSTLTTEGRRNTSSAAVVYRSR